MQLVTKLKIRPPQIQGTEWFEIESTESKKREKCDRPEWRYESK